MSLYIAVYDVHLVDRKQFERLLSRISDKRTNADEILYADSFGSEKALLTTPMKYDLFLIDAGLESLRVASDLRMAGILCPIVLYASISEICSLPLVKTMSKPIIEHDLLPVLDWAFSEKSKKTPRIELREEKNTYYVTKDEIQYISANDRFLDVFLTHKRHAHFIGKMSDYSSLLENNPEFLQLSKETLVNMNFIKVQLGRSFQLKNDTILSFPFLAQWRINSCYRQYRKNHSKLSQ